MENNQNVENVNYNGKTTPIVAPEGVKKWNWGAFMFNLYWGLGNKVYISLLCLIPIVNIIMYFMLGAKGNEWAWKNDHYRDVEEFKKAQSTWNRAGLIAFIITIIMIILSIIILTAAGVALADIFNLDNMNMNMMNMF